jgi:hypothetical protein
MDKEAMVVVIEKVGFCTTKKEKDVLKTDTVMCEVKNSDDGESVIHGRSKNKSKTHETKKV